MHFGRIKTRHPHSAHLSPTRTLGLEVTLTDIQQIAFVTSFVQHAMSRPSAITLPHRRTVRSIRGRNVKVSHTVSAKLTLQFLAQGSRQNVHFNE